MKLNIRLICLLFIFLLSRALAAGYQDAGDFSIWPMVSAYSFDPKRNFKDGDGPGVGIGYFVSSQWVAEASIMAYSTKMNAHGQNNKKNINGEYYILNGLYYFHFDDPDWQPYVTFGAGASHSNVPQQSDQTLPLVNAGAGLVYYFKENIGLRVGANDFYNFSSDGGYNDLSASIGLNIILDPQQESDPFSRVSPNDAALVESPAPIPCAENYYLQNGAR